MKQRDKTKEIRAFILEKVDHYQTSISQLIEAEFDLSRRAAYYHLKALVDNGQLETSGKRRAKRYKALPDVSWSKCYALQGLQEHLVWVEDVLTMDGFPELDRDTAGFTSHYGFTEMLNNAIDHSEGDKVCVKIEIYQSKITMSIEDNGLGIFKQIQQAENLDNEREAILLLAKGKYTSNPAEHSGQGIFFTSRAFDFFDIISGDLCFIHEKAGCNDWLLEDRTYGKGTTVIMELSTASTLNMEDLFDEFTSEDSDGEKGFDTTIVPVRKLRFANEGLISRSQAKRLMIGLHKFKKVRLDFYGVDRIGQAFSDEVFRVWASYNKGTVLSVYNANASVKRMIEKTLADSKLGGGG